MFRYRSVKLTLCSDFREAFFTRSRAAFVEVDQTNASARRRTFITWIDHAHLTPGGSRS